jgi:hypothetical protein
MESKAALKWTLLVVFHLPHDPPIGYSQMPSVEAQRLVYHPPLSPFPPRSPCDILSH